MSDLPDEFDCTVTNWEYNEFEPDMVVALARGGWFAGRCLCDFLGLDDLTSLKVEHYVGTGQTGDGPTIRYPMPDGSVAGKDVLVVDDIADTGGSIRRAHEYVTDHDPATVRTATLQLLGTSEFEPDYVGESLDEWTWIVYPWNFIEDMCDLIGGVMEADGDPPYSPAEIRDLLAEYHGIDRIEMEIAQPGRLDEVLGEMERRGLAEATDDGYVPA
ncbi:phosphoribosyltransferase [Halobacteriales archaeon SW_7_68_16]|nr:MAG: phosphoribosyltransferase [Halobacteriales archaeon SW_7_68_16]